MDVIGYIRVSTEDQAKEGTSLETQQASIKAYCTAKGWKLQAIEADQGIRPITVIAPHSYHSRLML